MKHDKDNRSCTLSLGRRFMRVCRKVARAIFLLVAIYAIIVLIGLIPVNNDFRPAANGTQVFLISNPVHADIVVPIRTDIIDWGEHFPPECFTADTNAATHVAIGWGDKGFFIHTPTWADLRVSTATKALFWPSATCLHVSMTNAAYLGGDTRSVTLSDDQYQRLVDYILASFQRDTRGDTIQVADVSYGANDAFFEAHGTYHCVNTCNCWVGRALQAAGVRTAWLTPLPKTVFFYLPEQNGSIP
jgi:uncharacterized protein (TIGR02117 family)